MEIPTSFQQLKNMTLVGPRCVVPHALSNQTHSATAKFMCTSLGTDAEFMFAGKGG